jgi:nucleotide sugar dehydrogenase
VSPYEELADRITSRAATVGVIGLGYVGLPVAVALAGTGFKVVGVDVDRERVGHVQRGTSYVRDVSDERVAAAREDDHLTASTSFEQLDEADVILICVPTPISDGLPDLSLVVSAGKSLAPVMRPGTVVILESTTYPGTTEELLQPLLEAEGLHAGSDFWLAFSPERVDPGNPVYNFEDIPKIVGGIDEESTRIAALFYEQVTPKVFAVSGTREAELSKLIENTFRHVNIALINELAVYASEMGIDIWESIEAAATKPFGFMPFWPSPGWGGHCIPLDPSYLSWRVRKDRAHEVRFVELAQAMNSEMPRYVAERVSLLLNEQGRSVRNSQICAIGVAYKAGTEDTRGSAALRVMSILASRGASVAFHDPLVEEAEMNGETLHSIPLDEETLSSQDLVIVFIPQANVDWKPLEKHTGPIFDCCNTLPKKNPNVTRL